MCSAALKPCSDHASATAAQVPVAIGLSLKRGCDYWVRLGRRGAIQRPRPEAAWGSGDNDLDLGTEAGVGHVVGKRAWILEVALDWVALSATAIASSPPVWGLTKRCYAPHFSFST